MGYSKLIGIKCKIFFRKIPLNFLLLIFSPRNQLILTLSQNLDKYIVLYQKELLLRHCLDNANDQATTNNMD